VEATAEPKYRLMLRELPPDERPREKMLLRGPLALTDGDLLAIILNTETRHETLLSLRQPFITTKPGRVAGILRVHLWLVVPPARSQW
jgi:DNA repair protein RadC